MSIRALIPAAAALALLAACGRTESPAESASPAETAPPAPSAPPAAPGSVVNPVPAADGAGAAPDPRRPQTLEGMQARLEAGFARADPDGDGVVVIADLPEGRGGGMLRRADADGDGRVTRAEAQAGARAMFERMDADGDGVISEDERPAWGGRRP